MQKHPSFTRTRQALATLIFVCLVITMLAENGGLSARKPSGTLMQTDEPASEGRRITPAGEFVSDFTTRSPALGALTCNFIRSPEANGRDGEGRYLIAVNSGFGIEFNSTTNRAQQSLAVIDLDAKPAPAVIQNVYFPSPQSVNVGAAFSRTPNPDGSFDLYASGGFENKIWIFKFQPGAKWPISPASGGSTTKVDAPFIDVSNLEGVMKAPHYNGVEKPIYPTGIAVSGDGEKLYTANNLDDSLAIVEGIHGQRTLERVALPGKGNPTGSITGKFTYPYAVAGMSVGKTSEARSNTANVAFDKIFVSLWNDASIAVIDLKAISPTVRKPEPRANEIAGVVPARHKVKTYIDVGRHPTAMILNNASTRLYVVNSDADSVSVIDTLADKEVERIDIHTAEGALKGDSPEGLALSENEDTLYVANSHSNSVSVVTLSTASSGQANDAAGSPGPKDRSRVRGLIPTGQYPSAVAIARGNLYVGNGKGTGVQNSSLVVNTTGRAPNIPNDRFPVGRGRGGGAGGEYSLALIIGNISRIAVPGESELVRYSQSVMRNNSQLGHEPWKLFPAASPIKHIIYVIRENRSYDQVLGDIKSSGNGTTADGDPSLCIFGSGDAAQAVESRAGTTQNITPNAHLLAMRFGLFDRFFVNSEASPDGHNWSTSAFSTDYTDKAYRWHYSGRGRTYDFEGFNRLPDIGPARKEPRYFSQDVGADQITDVLRQYIPYLHGSRDVAEPDSLYLWDAAARAGLSYRNYGEFVATISEGDVKEVNTNTLKPYPDISPTIRALTTKKTLEGHFNPASRSFDLMTPDSMTVDSYTAAKQSSDAADPVISRTNPESRFRGNSRLGEWSAEFQKYVSTLKSENRDEMPNLSILRLSNDHTEGMKKGSPTPQFFVAENDYAVGKLVETVSNSPYWKNTALFIVEDDAQDGPDHIDAHRSVALVISAYNKQGQLIHDFHNTVSLIRTMEMLLGMQPMNALDATAIPMDIFQTTPDLTPFQATMPVVAMDNLFTKGTRETEAALLMRRNEEQDFRHEDMADPGELNREIWFAVRGGSPMPEVARLPLFDVIREGVIERASGRDEDDKELASAGKD